MIGNIIFKIENVTGDAAEASRSTVLAEEVRAHITPASNEIIAFYKEVAAGDPYTVEIVGSVGGEIKPEAKFTVVSAETSPFSINDEFILKEFAQRSRIMGKTVYSGVVVRV
jgi:hypothetical protein